MPQILFAMHAPDGQCQVFLRSSQNARLANYFVTVGALEEWDSTLGTPSAFLAANSDGSEHLWIDCDLLIGDGGVGELWVKVLGNAASMWISVDGGEQVQVSTNFPPRDREKLAYRFGRIQLPRPGVPVSSQYLSEEDPRSDADSQQPTL
ncbi:MAG: hypothetical protein ABL921_33050 [Pirellula sp.]